MDFVSDAIARPGAISRRIKCVTETDDFTRECVDITADFGIGEYFVIRLLDRAEMFRGHYWLLDLTTGWSSRAGHL